MDKEYNARRGSATTQGYGSRWRAARAAYLVKHPVCVLCLATGRVTMATVVDHVQPHKGDRELFWEESNWQALCKRCHDTKTAREDGRWGARSAPVDKR